MANDLTTTDQAPGSQAISRLARQPQAWTMHEAMKLAGDDPVTVIKAGKADLLAAFQPVPDERSAQHAEWRTALESRINPIAAKIAPTMSKDQAAAWRDAMVIALSDLPAMIGLTATKRAIHVPMSFINEVEGVIRGIAAEIADGRREAIARLERLIADIERAANAQSRLEPTSSISRLSPRLKPLEQDQYIQCVGVGEENGKDIENQARA